MQNRRFFVTYDTVTPERDVEDLAQKRHDAECERDALREQVRRLSAALDVLVKLHPDMHEHSVAGATCAWCVADTALAAVTVRPEGGER